MNILFKIASVALLLALLLAGCTEATPTSVSSSDPSAEPTSSKPADPESQPSSSVPASSVPSHECQSSGRWQFDLHDHWRLCDAHGEQTELAAHAIQYGYCSICGVFFSDLDGWTLLHKRNEYGHLVLGLSYDENGVLMYRDFYEYTYNEEGTMLSSIYYENDILINEYRYNDHSHQIAEILYNADGTVQSDTRDEFAYDEQDRVISQKKSVNGKPTWEGYYAYVGQTRLITLQVYYEENGNKTATHNSYDDDANPTESSTYVNDVLTTKYEYACTSHPINGVQIRTARKYLYNPDGSYTLYDYALGGSYSVSVYDAEGNLLSMQYYDAKGNPIEPPEDSETAA